MKPKLIIIRGPPGSGKSTIAKEVGNKLNQKTIVFGKDGFLLGINFFKIEPKKAQREYVNLIVENYLKNKVNVVIEGIFGGTDLTKKLKDLENIAKKTNSDFSVFTLNCSLKTTYFRCSNRKGHIVKKPFPRKEMKYWYDYFYKASYKKATEIDTEKLNQSNAVKFILDKVK